MTNELFAHLRTDLLLVGLNITMVDTGRSEFVGFDLKLNLNSGAVKSLRQVQAAEGAEVRITRDDGIPLIDHAGVFTFGDIFPVIDSPAVESYALLFKSSCSQCHRLIEIGVTADGQPYAMLINDEE